MEKQLIIKIHEAIKAGKTPAFSYDRVSTQEQAKTGQSLEYQSDRAADYARRAGLEIVEYFSAAESAFKEGRIIFNKMISLALKNDVKDIIFKNTDRLGRNDIDWPRVKKLARSGALRVHLYELNAIFKAESTAEDELFLDNTSVMAKYWSNKISQGLRRSCEWRASKGIPPSRAPYGYTYNRENQTFIKHPAESEAINLIFAIRESRNAGFQAIADELNGRGLKTSRGFPWIKSSVEKILKNPIYAAFFYYDGIKYAANHEPYISEDQYFKNQLALNEKYVGARKRNFDFPLSGFLKNGSTRRNLTGEIKKGRYIYYTHRRPDFTISQENAFKLIDAEIIKFQFSDKYGERLKIAFTEEVKTRNKEFGTVKGELSKQISELEAKQQNYIELYDDGDIDREALKTALANSRAKINALYEKQKRLSIDQDKILLSITDCIDNLRDLPFWYCQGSEQDRADILRSMAKCVYLYQDRAVISWRPIYAEIIGIINKNNIDSDPDPGRGSEVVPSSTHEIKFPNAVDVSRALDLILEAAA